MDQSFDPVGDLNEGAERDQLSDPAMQFLSPWNAVGECLEGVRLRRSQGESGLRVPRVELEQLTGNTLSDPNDVRSGFESTPGQFGDRDEPRAGEDGVVGAVVQR